jgi:MFS family permease
MNKFKKDIYILFATRILRLFAYGALSVVLVLYLSQIGLDDYRIGLLITLTLIGDAIISLWITTRADAYSRKKMLILGSFLMGAGGIAFLLTDNYLVLTVTAIIAVISPTGKEIGPFLSIEQSALAQILERKNLTKVIAWYNLAGSFATAFGALCAGWLTEVFLNEGVSLTGSYKIIIAGYGMAGIILLIIFSFLSSQIEPEKVKEVQPVKKTLGLHKSKKVVFKLSSLFALDAFAGGFIIQSIIAYWFYLKFGLTAGTLGSIFFGTNLVAGISALYAARIANRIGLLNTMVFTHLPSNILLLLIPLMPNLTLAVGMLILRFSISQMDVPTRQAYMMIVVSEDERSAAAGISTISRSIGASVSPSICGILLANPLLLNFPFFFAGGLKIIYDLWLYASLRKVKVKE